MKKLILIFLLVFSLNVATLYAEEPLVVDPETQSAPDMDDKGSPGKGDDNKGGEPKEEEHKGEEQHDKDNPHHK